MKKIVICILIALIILVLGGIIIMALLNPLRKSEESIREDILELTPIGLTMEEVIETIENNREWTNEHLIFDRGYAIMRAGVEGDYIFFPVIYYSENNVNFIKTVGVKAIRLNIGNYHSPLSETVVLVYWAFNENGELIDIAVDKEVTSL
ncbi:MAG: hypothetical protein FWC68_02410 [Oscillospiraceae bacterium]|nr:hypothetical protein [Oscillospiraceae bacterium]